MKKLKFIILDYANREAERNTKMYKISKVRKFSMAYLI